MDLQWRHPVAAQGQHLKISGCSAIRSLPKDGLPNSLEELEITNCPSIRSLPKGGLPSSLRLLDVHYSNSEELRRQCRTLIGTIPIVRLWLINQGSMHFLVLLIPMSYPLVLPTLNNFPNLLACSPSHSPSVGSNAATASSNPLFFTYSAGLLFKCTFF